MNKFFALCLLTYSTGMSYAQGISYEWSAQMGGASTDRPEQIGVDSVGNIYSGGWFNGVADFDPGSATANLISVGSSDGFISKLDVDGNFEWALQIGGGSGDMINSLVVDDSGNTYVCGSFFGTVDFDPSASTSSLIASAYDCFVAKYSTDGDLVWAVQFGDAGFDVGVDIAIDNAGNIYTTGYFEGTVDTDPGAGTTTITSNGNTDAFIWKLANDGTLNWAVGEGTANSDFGLGLDVDPSENVTLSGSFQGSGDFDNGAGTTTLISVGGDDVFFVQLDVDGNFNWAGSFGSVNQDRCEDLFVDNAGKIYSTGWVQGDVDYDIGTGTTTVVGINGSECYIHVLSNDGTFDFVSLIEGVNSQEGYGITVDPDGNIYTIGFFGGSPDFDYGTGTTTLTADPSGDYFVTKHSNTGAFTEAFSAGSTTTSDYGRHLVFDPSGKLIIAGYFGGTADLDPFSGTDNFTAADEDIFITKFCIAPNVSVTVAFPDLTADFAGATYQWVDCNSAFAPIAGATNQTFTATVDGDYAVIITNGSCSDTSACVNISGIGMNEMNTTRVSLYPNPSTGEITIDFGKKYDVVEFTIYNSAGELLISHFINDVSSYTVNTPLTSGIYVAKITTDTGTESVRFVIQK